MTTNLFKDNGLSFQPIIDLSSGSVCRYEALSRFDFFTPFDVQIKIQEIESRGLAKELDRRIIRMTNELMVDPDFTYGKRLNINITGESFSSPLFGMWLESFVPKIENPHLLCAEITETMPITDIPTCQAIIDLLIAHQIEVYLDDVGSGYFTRELADSLKNYSGIKIDGSLVNGWDRDPMFVRITEEICGFSSGRGIPVVAEFIDSGEKMDKARSFGIQMAQGFRIGQPLPFPETPDSIENRLKRL